MAWTKLFNGNERFTGEINMSNNIITLDEAREYVRLNFPSLYYEWMIGYSPQKPFKYLNYLLRKQQSKNNINEKHNSMESLIN
jgi:hypothetical protein